MDTDEEQVEKLKAWLKENGLSIVLGVIIGVGGIGGYNYWNHSQDVAAAEASGHFTRMIGALESGDTAVLELEAEILIRDYASTDYALMAHLALARQQVEDGAFDGAAESLQQVVGSAAQKPLAYVARLRLAAVQLELERHEQALGTLNAEFLQQKLDDLGARG